MDHSLNELKECIFDYLLYHTDTPKYVDQIYDDISGPVGHRCSELSKIGAKRRYKDYFITTCYDMPNEYNNIQLFYKNSVCYLIYSNNKYVDNVTDQNIKVELLIKYGNITEIGNMVKTGHLDIRKHYRTLINYAITHKQYDMITPLADILVNSFVDDDIRYDDKTIYVT